MLNATHKSDSKEITSWGRFAIKSRKRSVCVNVKSQLSALKQKFAPTKLYICSLKVDLDMPTTAHCIRIPLLLLIFSTLLLRCCHEEDIWFLPIIIVSLFHALWNRLLQHWQQTGINFFANIAIVVFIDDNMELLISLYAGFTSANVKNADCFRHLPANGIDMQFSRVLS